MLTNKRKKLTLLNSPQIFAFLLLSYMTAILLLHVTYDFVNPSTYILYGLVTSVLQVLSYQFYSEEIFHECISEAYSRDLNFKEMFKLLISSNQQFHTFRSLLFFWGVFYLKDFRNIQMQLTQFNSIMDVYILYDSLFSYFARPTSNKALVKRVFNISLFIQFSLVISGFWCVYNN